jgi:hypothetical protein
MHTVVAMKDSHFRRRQIASPSRWEGSVHLAPFGAAADSPPRAATTTSRSEGVLAGAAARSSVRRARIAEFVVGPAVLMAATVVHPPHGGDAGSWFGAAVENPTRFYLAHILFLVGTLLLLPAVLRLSLELALRRPRLAVVGAGLSIAGGFGVAGLVGMDLIVWQMARPDADPKAMLALLTAVARQPAVILPLYGLTAALGLGFALLLRGLERSSVIPRGTVPITVAGLGLWAAGLPVPPLAITGMGFVLLGLARLAFAPPPKETARSLRLSQSSQREKSPWRWQRRRKAKAYPRVAVSPLRVS